MRFSVGRNFLTRVLISVRKCFPSRREICSCAVVNPRPAPVGGRQTNNCTAPALRLYMLPRRTRTCWDTSGALDWRTGNPSFNVTMPQFVHAHCFSPPPPDWTAPPSARNMSYALATSMSCCRSISLVQSPAATASTMINY